MKRSIIKITSSAWKKLADISLESDKKNFLFSALSGGCNGFNFDLNIMKDEDYRIMDKYKANYLSKDDVKVYIDPMSEMHLLGTMINYTTEDYKKGIFESKFVFDIDKNLASACGCGISFTPK